MSEKGSTILIADRNPHVREFLRRELLAEGYYLKLAKNGREVLKLVYQPGPLDLLILDLDLPDMDGSEILDILQDRIPSLPVILHAFSPENGRRIALPKAEAFVEKRGNSVDRLKKVVRDILGSKTPKVAPMQAKEPSGNEVLPP